MPKEKKDKKKAVRIEDALFELAREVMQEHDLDNFSEYVRGLLILDAQTHGKSIDHVTFPRWINSIVMRNQAPRASVELPTGGKPTESPGEKHDRYKAGKTKTTKKDSEANNKK